MSSRRCCGCGCGLSDIDIVLVLMCALPLLMSCISSYDVCLLCFPLTILNKLLGCANAICLERRVCARAWVVGRGQGGSSEF